MGGVNYGKKCKSDVTICSRIAWAYCGSDGILAKRIELIEQAKSEVDLAQVAKEITRLVLAESDRANQLTEIGKLV